MKKLFTAAALLLALSGTAHADVNLSGWTVKGSSAITSKPVQINALLEVLKSSVAVNGKTYFWPGSLGTSGQCFALSGVGTSTASITFINCGTGNVLASSFTATNSATNGYFPIYDSATKGVTWVSPISDAMQRSSTDTVTGTKSYETPILMREQSGSPTATANYGKLYTKASDNLMYFMGDDGVERSMGSAAGWSQGSNIISNSPTTDNVVIGNTALVGGAKLGVDGDADEVQLGVKGHSTQTAPIVRIQKDSGTDIFLVATDSVTLSNISSATYASVLIDMSANTNSLRLPNNATVTVNDPGEIAIDTNAISSSMGALVGYDGVQLWNVVATTNVPTTTGWVPQFNASTGKVLWGPQSGGGGGTATPAGADYNIQYALSGALAADAKFKFNPVTYALGVGTDTPVGHFHAKGDASIPVVLYDYNATPTSYVDIFSLRVQGSQTTRYRYRPYGFLSGDLSDTNYGGYIFADSSDREVMKVDVGNTRVHIGTNTAYGNNTLNVGGGVGIGADYNEEDDAAAPVNGLGVEGAIVTGSSITSVGQVVTGVTDLNFDENTKFTNQGYQILASSSPTSILADKNDYDVGKRTVIRLNSDAARAITGLANGQDGRILTLINTSSFAITLSAESASSVAANRFVTGATMLTNAVRTVWYDGTSSRWRIIGGAD